MPRVRLIACAAALLLVTSAPPPLRAQAGPGAVIKVATLAPAGSLWDLTLKQLGSDLRKGTGGRLSLNIFAGTQGDEATIVRKVRLNQLQGASLTILGLANVDPGFNVFTIPLFFTSYDELYYVMDKMTATFKARLEAKGFIFLGWGHGGWVQVFSRVPIRTLDEMKRTRIYTTAGYDQSVQWYKENGFRPVPLAPTDMLTGLQTGLIDAFPTPPLVALVAQWYKQATFMIDVNLGPLIGATVLSRAAWDRLTEADRALLVDLATQMDKRLRVDVPKQDADSVAEMEKRGLKVSRVHGTPEGAAFEAKARDFAESMKKWEGLSDLVDDALREREAFRRQPRK